MAPTLVQQSILGDEVPGWLDQLRIAALGKLGIPPSVADCTWLVAPGQQVHLGYARSCASGELRRHLDGRTHRR